MDLFGNTVEPLYDGEEIIGFNSRYDDIKEQLFMLKFKTARNNKFHTAGFWQKLDLF